MIIRKVLTLIAFAANEISSEFSSNVQSLVNEFDIMNHSSNRYKNGKCLPKPDSNLIRIKSYETRNRKPMQSSYSKVEHFYDIFWER